MSDAQALAGALAQGARLALEFNPVAGVAAAASAGLLAGAPRASRVQARSAAAAVVACWLLGDGPALAGALASAGQLSGPGLVAAAQVATWAIGGLCIGYAVPAAVGVTVGRRIIFGTARLAALMTGVATATAIAAISASMTW